MSGEFLFSGNNCTPWLSNGLSTGSSRSLEPSQPVEPTKNKIRILMSSLKIWPEHDNEKAWTEGTALPDLPGKLRWRAALTYPVSGQPFE